MLFRSVSQSRYEMSGSTFNIPVSFSVIIGFSGGSYASQDAIFSVAHFFAAHGWKDDLSIEEKRAIIWRYNKSDPYIDTVLKLGALLG